MYVWPRAKERQVAPLHVDVDIVDLALAGEVPAEQLRGRRDIDLHVRGLHAVRAEEVNRLILS